MYLHHPDLYIIRPGHTMQDCFAYSKRAEQSLANLLSLPCVLAEGNHSEHDFVDPSTGTTYEVKFQFKPLVTIEFEQANSTRPSGIAVSTADFWLIVNTSWTNAGEQVGKVRRYTLQSLQDAARQAESTDGKTCTFNPRQLDHVWLGDIAIDPDTRTWDLTKWKKRPYNLPNFN